MVGSGCADLRREKSPAEIRQLVDVHPHLQPVIPRPAEYVARRWDIEVPALAEDVAIFGEMLLRYPRQQLVHKKADVVLAIRWKSVRPQECRHEFDRARAVQLMDDTQDFDFVSE